MFDKYSYKSVKKRIGIIAINRVFLDCFLRFWNEKRQSGHKIFKNRIIYNQTLCGLQGIKSGLKEIQKSKKR